jgi:hypothetical protein
VEVADALPRSIQVATFIIQKILLDEMGLNYICATFERFSAVRPLSLADACWLAPSRSGALTSGFGWFSGEHCVDQHGGRSG